MLLQTKTAVKENKKKGQRKQQKLQLHFKPNQGTGHIISQIKQYIKKLLQESYLALLD